MIAIRDIAEKHILDMVVIPFNIMNNQVISETFLPINENKDEIKTILEKEC